MIASVIVLTITQVPQAAVAQPVERDRATVEAAGSTPARRSSCPSARKGVAYLIRQTWHWQRLSFQPRLEVPTSGRSCRQARAAAKRLRTEVRRAHLIYRLWLATPKLAGETPWHTSSANPVNQNLIRLAICETGGKPGQNGAPDWDHHARAPRGYYEGALGFLDTTWASRRWRVKPLPPEHAYDASPAEQLAVGRALVREFGGFSSWPSCHRRLGLAG